MSLVESFRTSPPRRQLTFVAVGAAMICAVLFAVYFLVLRKPYEVLFTDLRPMDAATIVAELEKKKIPHRLSADGETILVPQDQVATTRLEVMSQDLPLKGAVGFELFNKSDMGLTEFAQKINYQRALQGELARTIMTVEAVDSARVHLSMSEPTIFRADRVAPKASITIVTRPGKVLTAGAVQGIQRLVAAAVPDLEIGAVVIIDRHGEVLSSNPTTTSSPEAPLVQAQQAIEDYYAGRIRLALLRLQPADGLEVSVSAPGLALAQPIDGYAPAVENWVPNSRNFGLRITVSTATPLGVEEQDEVRRLINEAIGLQPVLGDSVAIVTSTVPQAATPSPPTALPSWSASEEPRKTNTARLSTFNWLAALALPLLLLLFAAAFVLERRRHAPRRLTVQQRTDYTERLKALLDKGETDVHNRA